MPTWAALARHSQFVDGDPWMMISTDDHRVLDGLQAPSNLGDVKEVPKANGPSKLID